MPVLYSMLAIAARQCTYIFGLLPLLLQKTRLPFLVFVVFFFKSIATVYR